MPIYRYTGKSALSEFRAHQLLKRLQAVFSCVTHLQTSYVYFVESVEEIFHDEQSRLMRLLQAEIWDAFSFGHQDPEYQHTTEVAELCADSQIQLTHDSNTLILVVPRLGTISPWSSKATDILTHSGFEKVNRIERGIVYI